MLPQTLIDCYNLESYDSRFQNILLSRFGIFQDSQGLVPAIVDNGGPFYGCFCDDCLPVIMKDIKRKKMKSQFNSSPAGRSERSIDELIGGDDDMDIENESVDAENDDSLDVDGREEMEYEYTDRPPMYAIANGNFIGHLPDRFQDLSRSEEATISLMIICIYLSTIVSSHMTVINTQPYIIKNPDPVLRSIPASTAGSVRVAMVGAFTEEKTARVSIKFHKSIYHTFWNHVL